MTGKTVPGDTGAFNPGAIDAGALDGNAIGGLLNEVFGTEMTAAIGICASCGTPSLVAETVVYLSSPGAIMRCRSCLGILVVVVRRGGMNCVDLSGLAALDVP